MRSSVKSIALLSAALISLTGCAEVFLAAGATGAYMAQPLDTNLVPSSYAAADYMIKQVDDFVKKDDLIKAVPLVNATDTRILTTVDKTVPEQIGTRLMQLGYNVDLSEVSTRPDAAQIAGAGGQKPDFILSGTHTRKARNTLFPKEDLGVSMQITDAKTGRVLTTFDYALPVSPDVKELSDPKPQIFRTPPEE